MRDLNPTRALALSGGALTLHPTPEAQPLDTWQVTTAKQAASALASRCGREVTQPLALTLELVCMGYSYADAERLAADLNRDEE